MPCLFVREFEGRRIARITPVVTPGCEWVLAGEGSASIKRDGTACAVIGSKLHARYDAKAGKMPPPNAVPCCDPDPVTGHWPHWVPVEDQPQFKWHREAWEACGRGTSWPPPCRQMMPDGTYELCGPKVQNNPEGLLAHVFIRHGAETIDAPRSFQALREFLAELQYEGVVFAHTDGRMTKIRRDDFGFAWPIPDRT